MNASINRPSSLDVGAVAQNKGNLYRLGKSVAKLETKDGLTLFKFFSNLQPRGINFNDKKLKQSCLNSLYILSIFIKSFHNVVVNEHVI